MAVKRYRTYNVTSTYCIDAFPLVARFDVAKRAGARLITSQGAFPGAEVCLLPFPDGRKGKQEWASSKFVVPQCLFG